MWMPAPRCMCVSALLQRLRLVAIPRMYGSRHTVWQMVLYHMLASEGYADADARGSIRS